MDCEWVQYYTGTPEELAGMANDSFTASFATLGAVHTRFQYWYDDPGQIENHPTEVVLGLLWEVQGHVLEYDDQPPLCKLAGLALVRDIGSKTWRRIGMWASDAAAFTQRNSFGKEAIDF